MLLYNHLASTDTNCKRNLITLQCAVQLASPYFVQFSMSSLNVMPGMVLSGNYYIRLQDTAQRFSHEFRLHANITLEQQNFRAIALILFYCRLQPFASTSFVEAVAFNLGETIANCKKKLSKSNFQLSDKHFEKFYHT